MRLQSCTALILSLISSTCFAIPSKAPLVKRCANSATDRSCWSDTFSLSTNYYDEAPDTGVTREYYLELVNTTAAPDGVSRNVLLVNGTFPGPTLFADWGDTVKVTLHNGLTNNGTGLHFHGIRQNYTNQNDGVPSVTQCPTAPGETITYTWKATQYGTTWYHSHFSLQAWEGVLGGIVINGPASGNYDEDLGHVFLNDWSHETADSLYSAAQTTGPPTLENGLINGTNTYNGGGSRFTTTFNAGTSYRIRLVNGAIDTHWKFMIDNHTFSVIAMDLVPIVPYSASVLSIGIGQRYDIVVTANQTAGDYWMRALPQAACSNNANPDDIKGIVRYDASSTADPTTAAYAYTDNCDDEAMTSLVPHYPLDVSAAALTNEEPVTVGGLASGIFKWYMAATTFSMPWENPTLLQLAAGTTNTTFNATAHVVELPQANEWIYFIVETTNAAPHPIHLHGHDFFVVAQGAGTYNSSTAALATANPPRRDVAMLPAAGHLVLAFQADNPGAWLMHCHIAWHTSEGLALQLVERRSEIAALTDVGVLNSTCAAWDTYAAAGDIVEEDSGV